MVLSHSNTIDRFHLFALIDMRHYDKKIALVELCVGTKNIKALIHTCLTFAF